MQVGGGVRVQVVMRSAAHVYTRLSASRAWRWPHVHTGHEARPAWLGVGCIVRTEHGACRMRHSVRCDAEAWVTCGATRGMGRVRCDRGGMGVCVPVTEGMVKVMLGTRIQQTNP